jgi:hypothetical protein
MSITAAPGGGNWSSTSTWVGGVVPGFTDDVLLTVTSGSVAMDMGNCQSLNCTGYTGTLTLTANLYIGDPSSAAGNLTFSAGMTLTAGTGGIGFIFGATTGSNTITTNGLTIEGSFTFTGAGSTWTLQDNVTMDLSPGYNGIYLSAGSLNFNGKTLVIGTYQQTGGALTCGAATITIIDGTYFQSQNQTWNVTGGTVSAASATINIPVGDYNTYQVAGGGNTYGTLSFPFNAATPGMSVSLDAGNTFTNLTFDQSLNTSAVPGGTFFSFAGNTTIGTLTIKGYSTTSRIEIFGGTAPTATTLTTTTNVFSYVDFAFIHGAGGANWNLSSITGKSGDLGGNTGITFTSPINCY